MLVHTEQQRAQAHAAATPAPFAEGTPVEALFPGALLALDPACAQETGEMKELVAKIVPTYKRSAVL